MFMVLQDRQRTKGVIMGGYNYRVIFAIFLLNERFMM